MVSRRGFLASSAATAAVAGIGVASGAAGASFLASQNADTSTWSSTVPTRWVLNLTFKP